VGPSSASFAGTPSVTPNVTVNTTQASNSNDGLFTGMLMGEMLAGNHGGGNNTTIIERDHDDYVPSAPETAHEDPIDTGSSDSFDTGDSNSSFDSGSSDSNFDVGSSDSFDTGGFGGDSSSGW
jgi:hypothetical protein